MQINIQDSNLKSYLLHLIPHRYNFQILEEEASVVSSLYIENIFITTLKGLEAFVNLQELAIVNICLKKQDLKTVTKLKHLKKLILSNCNLSNIKILKRLRHLSLLDVSFNQVEDISFLRKLPVTRLNLRNNNCSSLKPLLNKTFYFLDISFNNFDNEQDLRILIETTRKLLFEGNPVFEKFS